MTNNDLRGCAAALGCFDGLHTGHLNVINKAAELAKEGGLELVVFLFDEHPLALLGGKAPEKIITDAVRNSLLAQLGARAVTLSFRDIMKLTPEQFVGDILIGRYGMRAAVCGENYRFGAGALGNADLLTDLCRQYGAVCAVAQTSLYKGEPVSSTRIRAAINEGRIDDANAMLGREFTYDFQVVGGDRRGRLLGAPTINQFFPEDFCVPGYGVYASETLVDGKIYPSVTNIGLRPTFGGDKKPRSETWIMEYSGNLYGRNIPVSLNAYLRAEKRFDSSEQLVARIKADGKESEKIFFSKVLTK